jgi:uncharacterized membrane protein YdjX (TVP38/TMEM64 family)
MLIYLKNKKEIIRISISVIIIAILFILATYFFTQYQTQLENTIGKYPILGMIIYILIFILSIVFAPISAVPIIPLGTSLWGILVTTILSVIGWTIGAMIAFYIARKYGKPYVSKIISLEKLAKIEKLIPHKNIFLTIFFLRTIMPFDGLSYALGLISRINTKTFFWATFLGLIPFCFVISYLGTLPIIYLITGLTLAGLFLIVGILKVKKNQ